MNIQAQIIEKEQELKIIENILTETLIISQLKYLDYMNEQTRLNSELLELRKQVKNQHRKTWKTLEGGWYQRINNE